MTPRYYQNQADTAIDDYIKSGGRRGLVVLPGGSGKSFVQAKEIQKRYNEGARLLLLTHQVELIKQNYTEMMNLVSFIDAGIYSASLNLRHTDNQVIFAQIQSVHKKALHLGRFDIVMIDEVHLVPQKSEGTYRKFLDKQFEMNPDLVLLGLTATPYRLGGGYLNHGKDSIFKDIIHETPIDELIDANHENNLDGKQYLSTLISKKSVTKVDLSEVKLVAGEYNKGQMETAFDEVVEKSVKELLEYTVDRKRVLIFASGIKHAEHIASLIPGCGIVHSKVNNYDLEDFKSGKLKYLVNVGVLTTGTNIPAIDCIALMRSTKSPNLYVQMVCRGTRLSEESGKTDCLVLDFGENVLYHGPIDKINISNPSGKKGEAPVRECPNCHSLIFAGSRFCPDCGEVFEFEERPSHNETATDKNVISEKLPPERVEIAAVEYYRHKKEGKPDSMRVDYLKNMYSVAVSEYICLDHGGFAGRKAHQWVKERLNNKGLILSGDISNVDELLKLNSFLNEPTAILVDYNDKFARIVGYEWAEVGETEVLEVDVMERAPF